MADSDVGSSGRTASHTDAVLAALAGVFLAAYAWPILQPDLPGGLRATCSIVIAVVWLAFLVDYASRLVTATQRGWWFWRHLPELLVLILPVLRPLRLLRVLTLLKIFNRTGTSRLRGQVVIYVVAGSTLLAVLGALAVLDAERGRPGANIEGFGDALWWACTTMTTVGYGDRYPVTTTGRLVAVGLMLSGIALLGAVTASIASWLVESVSDSVSDDLQAGEALTRDLVEEVRSLRAEVASLRATMSDLPEVPRRT